jgi:hypothetical protein
VTDRRTRIALVLGVACGLLAAAPRLAWSHAADAMPPTPGSVVMAPRTEARIGQFEMVTVFSKQIFAVFLSRYADGTPVAGAKIEAGTDLQSADLTETDPGVYSTKELLMAPGRNDLTIKIRAGEVTTTQPLALILPTEQSVPVASGPIIATPLKIGAGIVVVYGLLSAGFLLTRRRYPQRVLARATLRAWRA